MKGTIIAALVFCLSSFAQTFSPVQPVDLSHVSTIPNQVGLAVNLPTTCSVGQTYFETDVVTGKNAFQCTSTNLWSPVSVDPGTYSTNANKNVRNLPASLTSFTMASTALYPGGLASATYVSGITASGTGTCTLFDFNDFGVGTTATVPVTSGTVGSTVTVTNPGYGFTAPPTTALSTGSGGATCSGTATLSGATMQWDWGNPPSGDGAGVGNDIVWDPISGQYAMVYAAYGATNGSSQIGLAYSSDGVNWTKYASNPVLSWNSTSGKSDSGSITFPQLFNENGTWYMTYIGFTLPGNEQGRATINIATAAALTGPWTKYSANPIIDAVNVPWTTGSNAFRGSISKVGNTYWLWFNAGYDSTGHEGIGYATASSPTGPWTANPTEAFNITQVPGAATMSDPQVFTVGNLWYMMGYSANVGDWLAWTRQEAYPNGWTYGGTIVSAANQAGGRPVLTTITGTPLLYSQHSPGIDLYIPTSLVGAVESATTQYNALCLACAPTGVGLPRGQAPNGVLQIGSPNVGIAGDTGINITSNSATNEAGVTIGQDSSHQLLALWHYDPTAANGYFHIETYGGNNPICFMCSGGNVEIGGTGFGSKFTVKTGDINIASSASGLVLKDTSTGTCYRVQVTSGALALTSLTCPAN